jgi:FkbM family methyltransferase
LSGSDDLNNLLGRLEDCPDCYIKDMMKNKFPDCEKICVWGMGSVAEIILPQMKKHLGDRLVCVSDNNPAKWNKDYLGLRCVPPRELLQMKGDIGVYVSVINSAPVIDELTAMGFRHIINNFCGIPYSMLAGLRSLYHESYKTAKDELAEAFSLMGDERSKEVFLTRLHYCLFPEEFGSSPAPLRRIHDPNQYFPPEIIHLRDDEVFVDGGGYVGDTVEDFMNRSKGEFEHIYSFEPDADNYKKLSDNISALQPTVRDKITAYQLGLWDCEKASGFAGVATGTHVLEQSSDFALTHQIMLDSLDRVLGEFAKVTFIKMDVEGSEKKAIDGAREIIGNNRPKLAICVYHRPHDIFDLPLKIHKLNPNYRLYLRHHASDWRACETVCYAV